MVTALWHDRPTGALPDMATMLKPEVAIDIQRRFAHAGADILKTLSFAANALAMPRIDTVKLCGQAVSHCRAGARAAGRKVLVAGCIGQLTRETADRPAAEIALAFSTQAKALIDAGADILLYETIYDTTQARIALDGIMRSCAGTPLWLSAVCSSIPAKTLAELAADYGAAAAGYNCTPPGGAMEVELRHLGNLLPRLPLFAAPSATPRFTALAAAMTRSLALSCIGGCCGVTPRHISALRRTLNINSHTKHQINA